MKTKLIQLVLLFSALLIPSVNSALQAQEPDSDSSGEEILVINEEIDRKNQYVDDIKKKIKGYESEIEKKRNQASSLANESEILANRAERTKLDIESTNVEIEVSEMEIEMMNNEITQIESKLESQKETIAEILRRINSSDKESWIQIIFGTTSFSELFEKIKHLENLGGDLDKVIDATEELKNQIENQLNSKEQKIAQLQELKTKLLASKTQYEEEISAKDSLIAEVHQSESEYKTLVSDLKSESQSVNSEIAYLQEQIEKRIVDGDEVGDLSKLSWPVNPSAKGISATFHDPTYPFRYLFEHSGTDMPQVQGTQVVSAASGYVASVKTGRLYGNYITIVHANGISTLYAHLSKQLVSVDQYVKRGEVIALSGGARGTAGAGFSTGAHLHFEVRLNGIPVNPMNYLMPL